MSATATTTSTSKMPARTGTKSSVNKSLSKNVNGTSSNGGNTTAGRGAAAAAAAAGATASSTGTTKNAAIQQPVATTSATTESSSAVLSSPPINDYSENTCIVCFKEVDIFSIGDCNHAVCYECSTRMRVLCCQNECPICRQDLAKVIFTKVKKGFRQLELDHRNGLYDKKYRICFEDVKIRSEFYKLLEYRCRSCKIDCFQSFRELEDHLRSQHERFYCDFCTDNLKIFSFERKLYSYKELGVHKTIGDADNKSHRGHPLCEFCHIRYFDRDELFRHMRREHFFCHFCDADGVCNQFYPDYMSLRGHYTIEHFLCEEGECADEQFTAVFRSDIDLRAHKAQVHGKGLGKTASKQARTLEFEFTLPPRNRQGESSRNQGQNRVGGRSNDHHHHQQQQQQNRDDDSELGASSNNNDNNNNNNNNNSNNNNNNNNINGMFQNQSSVYQIDTQNTEQFPSLGGGGGGGPGSTTTLTLRPNVSIHTKSYGTSGLARTKENFPALGSANSDGSLAATTASTKSIQSNAANTLFKQTGTKRPQMVNGNEKLTNITNKTGINNQQQQQSKQKQKPGMIIHVSNRPTSSNNNNNNNNTTSSTSNEFPSLPMSNAAKKKAQLYEDLVLPGAGAGGGGHGSSSSTNYVGTVATKHRSLINQFDYSSCVSNTNDNTYNKLSFVQQNATTQLDKVKKIDVVVPKINSTDSFPTLGGKSANVNNPSNTNNNNNNNNLPPVPLWVTKKSNSQQSATSKLKNQPSKTPSSKAMVLKITNNGNNRDDDDQTNKNKNNNMAMKTNTNKIDTNNNNINNNNNNERNFKGHSKMMKIKAKNKQVDLSGYMENTAEYKAIEEYISVKHRPLTKGGFMYESTKVNSKLNLISELPTPDRTPTRTKTKTKSTEDYDEILAENLYNNNDDYGYADDDDDDVHYYDNLPVGKPQKPQKPQPQPQPIKSYDNFPQLKKSSNKMNNNNNNNGGIISTTKTSSSSSSSTNSHLNSIYSVLLKSNLNSEMQPSSRSRRNSSHSNSSNFSDTEQNPDDFIGNGGRQNKKGGSKGAIPKNSGFINSVTLNSIVKPTNNLTFTTSTGEQYSILPQVHQYMPPDDATQRNLDLVTKVQNILVTPEAVDEFKNISQLFRDDGYHAYPYYEHCEIVLANEFDRIFPELLSLLPDISKQQELYLVYSQQLKIYNKEAKSKKKKPRTSIMEVCTVCKQVLINTDYPPHMQAHIFLSEFPDTLG